MPTAASLGEMMRTLLGARIGVKPGTQIRPRPRGKIAVGTFVTQEDETAVLWVCDIEFAARAAGCLTGMPHDTINAEIRMGDLSTQTAENAYEIINIGTSLFNNIGAPHMRLTEFRCMPISDFGLSERTIIRMPKRRADYEVDIADYGAGQVSFLVA